MTASFATLFVPSKNPAQRLRDVVDNIEAIWGFTAGMDQWAFSGDRKTVYAVDDRMLWQVAQDRLKPLHAVCTAELARLQV